MSSLGPADPTRPIRFGGIRRHYTGRFTQVVLANLDLGVEIDLDDGTRVYVALDDVELGDSPAEEEVSIRFRLSQSRPGRPAPRWEPVHDRSVSLSAGSTTSPETGSGLLFFTFSSEVSWEQNFADLRDFVREFGALADTPPGEA